MLPRYRKIVQASLDAPAAGVIELGRDWRVAALPPLGLNGVTPFAQLKRVPEHTFGRASGYFVNEHGELFFFVLLRDHPELDPAKDALYVVGDFNGWQESVGHEAWCLVPGTIAGEPALLWSGRAARFESAQRFKFVTSQHHWLPVPPDAPNAVRDAHGNINREMDPQRTGRLSATAPASRGRGTTRPSR